VNALEVLAANDVEVMLDIRDGVTPTPVVSQAILSYNRGRSRGLADGIVITPSHNPPAYGGFKYNPPAVPPTRMSPPGSRTEPTPSSPRTCEEWPGRRTSEPGARRQFTASIT
jgi:hypothetical protein